MKGETKTHDFYCDISSLSQWSRTEPALYPRSACIPLNVSVRILMQILLVYNQGSASNAFM